MGSKSQIAKHIVPIIQDYIDKNNIETKEDRNAVSSNKSFNME